MVFEHILWDRWSPDQCKMLVTTLQDVIRQLKTRHVNLKFPRRIYFVKTRGSENLNPPDAHTQIYTCVQDQDESNGDRGIMVIDTDLLLDDVKRPGLLKTSILQTLFTISLQESPTLFYDLLAIRNAWFVIPTNANVSKDVQRYDVYRRDELEPQIQVVLCPQILIRHMHMEWEPPLAVFTLIRQAELPGTPKIGVTRNVDQQLYYILIRLQQSRSYRAMVPPFTYLYHCTTKFYGILIRKDTISTIIHSITIRILQHALFRNPFWSMSDGAKRTMVEIYWWYHLLFKTETLFGWKHWISVWMH